MGLFRDLMDGIFGAGQPMIPEPPDFYALAKERAMTAHKSVFVVMGNDTIDCVFSTESAADAYVAKRKLEDQPDGQRHLSPRLLASLRIRSGRKGVEMTANVLQFPTPPNARTITLTRVDGEPWSSATFATGAPSRSWMWIEDQVWSELGPCDVGVADDDVITADGLPVGRVVL